MNATVRVVLLLMMAGIPKVVSAAEMAEIMDQSDVVLSF